MNNHLIKGDIREYLFSHLASQPPTNFVQGNGISGGAVCGEVVFSREKAKRVKNPIFFQYNRDPHEVETIYASKGYVTLTNMAPGAHPVILSRIKGIPVIMDVNEKFTEGEQVTIDGMSGKIFRQSLEINKAKELPVGLEELLKHKNGPKVRSLMVLPDDPTPFSRFNAEGIGPFATEYMFFEGDQLEAFQRLIILNDEESRELIKQYQRETFCKLFRMANGEPVAIRYFDPPLHEFLPTTEVSIELLAKSLGISFEGLSKKVHGLEEENPAFGYRGSRIGLVQSDIYLMQTETIFEAAIQVQEEGIEVDLELIYPLISDHKEIDCLNELVLHPVTRRNGNIKYKLGIMVELPSACLDGEEISKRVQTVSFGTNDLTQATLGMSRDDSQRYIGHYIQQGILSANPFRTLHPHVVSLMNIFIDSAKKQNPDLEMGICGAHASDLISLKVLKEQGINMDYHSVMPYSIIQTKLEFRGEVQ
ncbi:MAG: putative PEP-binding protein [Candidatus Woesearchaeota archaeon]